MGRGTDLSQLFRNTNKDPIGVRRLLNYILRTYLLRDDSIGEWQSLAQRATRDTSFPTAYTLTKYTLTPTYCYSIYSIYN